MYRPEDEMGYEEKLDKVSEYLEDLILDAMISVFQKCWKGIRCFMRLTKNIMMTLTFNYFTELLS